jgi:hypothetical protein
MKTLRAKFRLNGLPYTLLKRNEVVAMYGIGGTYTDDSRNLDLKFYFLNLRFPESV